jgi:hypothetical protein
MQLSSAQVAVVRSRKIYDFIMVTMRIMVLCKLGICSFLISRLIYAIVVPISGIVALALFVLHVAGSDLDASTG